MMDTSKYYHECVLCCGCASIPTVPTSRRCCQASSLHTACSQDNPLTATVIGRPSRDCSRSKTSTTGAIYHRTMSSTLGMLYVVAVVVMALLLAPSAVVAFNVDLETALVHEGDSGSMFGYAVAQHIDQSTNWLLIGAPRAQTSQPGVTKGGAVYRCKTDRQGSCQEIPFDDTGNNIKYDPKRNQYHTTEDKSDQWFGSTIRSSGENGVIVACAPRYTYFSQSYDKREPVGMCYVAKTSTTKYEKYAPCATDQWGFHRQGFCQAGTSAALSQDGKRLLIGAPGSWYWQGQLYNYRTEDGGQIFSSTPEGSADKDDTYMGYASAIGEFDGDNVEDYVVGIPKGQQNVGRIEMYTQNMTLIGGLDGEQVGSYFGSVLAVADLNGDRIDDIIVGAPLYADFSSTDAFDTGRVYIFYQLTIENIRSFKNSRRDILDGNFPRSRFGMAISGLGDINFDGFNDLCIGAPYAGEDKNGAIYIYHGSKKGIITEASQIIYAKDLKVPLSAFGISISGGWDQDGNYYPDMLVGAYESDKAVFLRTRAVVKVYANLKIEPEMINLESKSCTLQDNTRVPCLTVYTCMQYEGKGVPDELHFDVTWVLDAKESNRSGQEIRAFFIKNLGNADTAVVKLQKNNTYCTSSYAYVKNEPGDKLSPIKTTMEFKLKEGASRRRRDLPPILDAYVPTTTSFTAHIQKDCGSDNICVPDLIVEAIRVSAAHIIGSTTSLEILIIVSNRGEDSFNTKLWIDLPPGVSYRAVSNDRSPVPVSCGTHEGDATMVVCDMGNPLQKDAQSEFTLNLTPTNSNNTKDRLVFAMLVNSSNKEDPNNYMNNQVSVEIPVTAVAEIALYGKASPEIIFLNTTEPRGVEEGRMVDHVFHLLNQGHSATNETELQVRWPSYDIRGNPVLILEGGLKTEGNGKCNIIYITPNNASGYLGWGGSSTNVVYQGDGDRNKRDVDSQKIACTDRYCTIIQCLVGYMAPRQNFVLTVKSRFMARNFIRRREATQMYHITSIAHARVRSVPYDFESVDVSKFEVKRLELVTKVNTDRLKPASKGVEPWVIAVAVTAGILLLILLILLLWCCGFFKRKKPEDEGYFVVNGKTDIDNKIVD